MKALMTWVPPRISWASCRHIAGTKTSKAHHLVSTLCRLMEHSKAMTACHVLRGTRSFGTCKLYQTTLQIRGGTIRAFTCKRLRGKTVSQRRRTYRLSVRYCLNSKYALRRLLRWLNSRNTTSMSTSFISATTGIVLEVVEKAHFPFFFFIYIHKM